MSTSICEVPSLSRFKSLIANHRSACHPVFDYIETCAAQGTLTAEAYSIFSANIAARTMLSLSEIHACCIQSSLDLDPLRTAYGVMTGAEEGGFGKPANVHTVLMMKALNFHGDVAYGLPSIELNYLMALVRIVFVARQRRIIIDLEKGTGGALLDRIQDSGLFDLSGLFETCRRLTAIANIQTSVNSWNSPQEIDVIEETALALLARSKVLPETIDYCLEQLSVLANTRPGYLQGVGFAHEALADGMIYRMFRILFTQIDLYESRQHFMTQVYPYFSAHGNYLDVFNGQPADAEGVELVHAQRELAKLACLDNGQLEAAWKGANDFANRNVRIWDGLLRAFGVWQQPAMIGAKHMGVFSS